MPRTLIIAAACVFGVVGLGVAYWLASPLWTNTVVTEELAEVSEDQTTTISGAFSGKSARYQGAGNATIVELDDGTRQIQFTDFSVTNGPALQVWLSSHPFPRSEADVNDNDWVNLGALKGNLGDQAYDIPADVDLSQYQSVVIWCRPFGVLFSSAALEATDPAS